MRAAVFTNDVTTKSWPFQPEIGNTNIYINP